MSQQLKLWAIVFFVVYLKSAQTHANPEPSATYDARVVGMAGTAVAHVNNSTAVAHNPAGLALIDHWDFSVASALLAVKYNAPFAGPGSEQDSPPLIAPLPFAGGAGRITDRLVIGGAVYVTTGFGGGFSHIARLDDYTPRGPCLNADIGVECTLGGETEGGIVTQTEDAQSVTLFVAEAAASLGIEITERFRVGISIRLPWARQATESLQEAQSNQWTAVNQQVSGFGYPSATVGLQWDPIDRISLGFVYRARATPRMSGTNQLRFMDSSSVTTFGAETAWVTPHMIRGGISSRFFQQRLLLSLEGRIQFHRQANDAQRFYLSHRTLQGVLDALGINPFVAPFEWQNVYAFSLGAEYQVADHWWLRAGGSTANSATPESTVSPFAPPPGINFSVTGGFGAEFGQWRFDVGYQHAVNGPYTVTQRNAVNCRNDAQQKAGCDGTYQINAHTLSFSVGYSQ